MTNQDKMRLFAFTDGETQTKLMYILSTQTDVEIVGTATCSEEGIQNAIELQPDIILIDYFLPRTRSECDVVVLPSGQPFRWREWHVDYDTAERVLSPLRENAMRVSQKLARELPGVGMILMAEYSYMTDDFRELFRLGIFKSIVLKPIYQDEIVETLQSVSRLGGGKV